MMLQRNARLLIAVPAAVIAATTACTSGTTGEPTPSSASASVEASSAFPSESVPPGVEKDSVLDLNSTKDMTGVVTTVPFGESPYAAHLPDICDFIPRSVEQRLGVDTKKRGFKGTQLISQACDMIAVNQTGTFDFSITVNFFTNNIREILDPGNADTLERDIKLGKAIEASTTKVHSTGPSDVSYKQVCGTAWGTFFGAIVVNYRTSAPEKVDPCQQSIDAAREIAPFMPKSPSEMRPAA